MDIITLVIIVLLAVIVGLAVLLYKTVNRRNQTTIVMAELVRDLAWQNAERQSADDHRETTPQTMTQRMTTPQTVTQRMATPKL